jgi:hypothetical protein
MLHVAVAYQDHLEVVDVSDSTQHRPVDGVFQRAEPRGNVQAVLVAGDRIPDKELMPG